MKTLKKTILVLLAVIALFGCSNNDTEDGTQTLPLHRLEFKTDNVQPSAFTHLKANITFTSGPGEDVDAVYNNSTSTFSIDFPENTVRFRAVFSTLSTSEVEIKFYNVESNEMLLHEYIQQDRYILEHHF